MNDKVIKLLQNVLQILSAATYTVTGREMDAVQNERKQLAVLLEVLQSGAFSVVAAPSNPTGVEASDAPDIGGDGEPDTSADGAGDEGHGPIGPAVTGVD